MVTVDDVQELLTQRLAEWPRLPRDDFGLAFEDRHRLRLPPQASITKLGWCWSEIEEVPKDGRESIEEYRARLAAHWLGVWQAQDQAEEATKARQEAAAAERKAKALERERAAEQAEWRKYGPPGAYGRLKVESLVISTDQQRKVLGAVSEAVGGPHSALFLLGPPGTGKTSFAALWLRQWFEDGVSFEWITGRQFDLDAREAGDDNATINRFSPLTALVIDDVEPGMSPLGRRLLAEVMDRRRLFAEELGVCELNPFRTVVTSNLSVQQIRDEFGERAFSRLFGAARVEALTGDDLRLKPPRPRGG